MYGYRSARGVRAFRTGRALTSSTLTSRGASERECVGACV